METTGNQNVDLNSQFGTIVATHPHLQLNRNSILSRPPSISFVVHPCPSFARFCESFLISAIKTLLGDKCKFTGTTGLAGCNIKGCTLHSALQLPVRNHNNANLQGAALQRLQLRFPGNHYLITDEMSMLGQRHTSLGRSASTTGNRKTS